MICVEQPNLLLLDEPTNHLDIEAIDSLTTAINKYAGRIGAGVARLQTDRPGGEGDLGVRRRGRDGVEG